MNDVSLFGSSPFDAIRQVRPDGSEYWTARDLMPVMAYARWENFLVPVNRAMKTAANTGMDVTSNFLGSRKVSGSRGPAGDDYELTRQAAYLVSMNGDPNKPEVAAAQVYFAVKTREAEVRQSLPDISTPTGVLAMAEQFAATARQLVATERLVAEQAPKVSAYDTYMDARNALAMGAVANQLGVGRNTMMRRLRESGVLQKDNRPYQRYAHHFKVVAQTYEAQSETRATYTTYVWPSGVELIRKVLSGGKGLLSIAGGAA